MSATGFRTAGAAWVRNASARRAGATFVMSSTFDR